MSQRSWQEITDGLRGIGRNQRPGVALDRQFSCICPQLFAGGGIVEQFFYASDKLLGGANNAVVGRKLQSASSRRSGNYRQPGGKVVEHFEIGA